MWMTSKWMERSSILGSIRVLDTRIWSQPKPRRVQYGVWCTDLNSWPCFATRDVLQRERKQPTIVMSVYSLQTNNEDVCMCKASSAGDEALCIDIDCGKARLTSDDAPCAVPSSVSTMESPRTRKRRKWVGSASEDAFHWSRSSTKLFHSHGQETRAKYIASIFVFFRVLELSFLRWAERASGQAFAVFTDNWLERMSLVCTNWTDWSDLTGQCTTDTPYPCFQISVLLLNSAAKIFRYVHEVRATILARLIAYTWPSRNDYASTLSLWDSLPLMFFFAQSLCVHL